MSTDTSTSPVVAPVATEIKGLAKTAASKKAAAPKVSKPKIKPAHPAASEMVNTAIEKLSERSGSSLPAIKKYIVANYKVDIEKQALFIKKYLKSAVAAGLLIQVKGKGANGSFKMPKKPAATKSKAVAVKKDPAAKKATVKKASLTKSPGKVVKKNAVPKKVAAKKAATGEKKAVKSAAKGDKAKVPSKAKKTIKAPTAKPKAPKPKKAIASKAAAKSPPKKTQKK